MSKGLTFGRFYPSISVLHQLDPRVKLISTLLFLVELFVFNSLTCYIMLTAFLAVIIAATKIPLRFILSGSKFILVVILFTSTVNLFIIDGDTLVSIGKLHITNKGLNTAILISVRLMYIYISSSIMMITTSPNNLTDGMDKLLEPLKKVKVPVHDLSMITSITLRFIPVLSDEATKIIKAQTARGVNFRTKNIIKRIRNYIPIMIPMFVSSFRRSNELAMAMESRGYRGDNGRSKMRPLCYHKIDIIAYFILLFFLVAQIVVKTFNL